MHACHVIPCGDGALLFEPVEPHNETRHVITCLISQQTQAWLCWCNDFKDNDVPWWLLEECWSLSLLERKNQSATLSNADLIQKPHGSDRCVCLNGCSVSIIYSFRCGCTTQSSASFQIQRVSSPKTNHATINPLPKEQNSGLLVVPRIAKSTKGGRTFSYLAPKLWNSLPDNVQGSDTLSLFNPLVVFGSNWPEKDLIFPENTS